MAFTKEQLAKLGIVVDKDEVTDEEALGLIEKKNADLVSERNKLKKRTDELSSELADKKKQDQEKLSEEERQKLLIAELQESNQKLNREISRNKKINDLMSIGYDQELATKFADAELDGKSTVEFQKQFMNSKLEAQKQELLKGGKVPKVDNPDKATEKFTKENFKKGIISMSEMNELKEKDPTLYNELING